MINTAHSHQDLFYHFVWTPKYRTDLITEQIKSILLPFLTNKALSLECRVLALNCMEDHVHMLLFIPARLSVAYVINVLKGSSSHEIKKISPEFSWQMGYGVTTLRRSDIPIVQKHIQNQEQHHQTDSIEKSLEISLV